MPHHAIAISGNEVNDFIVTGPVAIGDVISHPHAAARADGLFMPAGQRWTVAMIDWDLSCAQTEVESTYGEVVERNGGVHRCSRCKRDVNPAHLEVLCDGEAASTCHAYACGLPIYERTWDRRSSRSYCAAHHRDAQIRREAEEGEAEAENDRRRRESIRSRVQRNTRALQARRAADAELAVELFSGSTDELFEAHSGHPRDTMLSSTVQEEIMPQESLLNDQFRPPPSSDRVLMNVHPDTRERLRDLLATAPELQGVGYSAFINRAIEVAIEQIDRRRRLAQVRFSNYNADLEVDLRRGEDGLSDLGLGD